MAKEKAVEQSDQLTGNRASTDVNVWVQLIGAVFLAVLTCLTAFFADEVGFFVTL